MPCRQAFALFLMLGSLWFGGIHHSDAHLSLFSLPLPRWHSSLGCSLKFVPYPFPSGASVLDEAIHVVLRSVFTRRHLKHERYTHQRLLGLPVRHDLPEIGQNAYQHLE